MSLQFILGSPGSGKTTYSYEKIIRDSMLHPHINYIILVPEQFTMETQRKLCLMHPRGGIMNIDVLSFGRLAYRIFEETGMGKEIILDDEGKNLILRRIMEDCEQDLHVLGGNLSKQGYISEVKSILSEFSQYGVDDQKLEELKQNLPTNTRMYLKLQDIQKIMHGFHTFIKDQFITKEEILEVLATAVPLSSILEGSVILLDGFTGFTPVQMRLIEALLIKSSQMMITATSDPDVDILRYEHPYQLFALSKQMLSRVLQLATKKHIDILDPVFLYPKNSPRFQEREELSFLSRSLFRVQKSVYQGDTGSISLSICHNPSNEVEAVASKIRRFVRTQGLRYQEIAVIVSEIETYIPHIEQSFQEYQIPYFTDYKKSIMLNGAVDYLRSILQMIITNFRYDSVFRYLRSGFTTFTNHEIDLFDNHVRAHGIRGFSMYQQVWGAHIQVEEDSIRKINQVRERFVASLQELVDQFTSKHNTVYDLSYAFYTFVQKEGLEDFLKELQARLEYEGELTKAKEYGQIFGIFVELLDKLVSLLGEQERSAQEFSDLLDAGFQEAKVGLVPPGLDQVVVGDLMRTRISEVKVLFFLGANDQYLPGNLQNMGLLSEREREVFRLASIPLSPSAREQIYIQQFYLYLILTKPSTYLQVSYSNLTTDGKSIRPAYLVTELKRLYQNLHIEEQASLSILTCELYPRRGLQVIASSLSNRELGIPDECKELLSWAMQTDGEQNRYLSNIVDGAFRKNAPMSLSNVVIQDLYGDLSRFSVSRLESFSSCAYAHFLSYGLRLKERKQFEIQSVDFGIIAHKAIELFSKYANEHNEAWHLIDSDIQKDLVQKSVSLSIEAYGEEILKQTARSGYQEHLIRRLLERSVWALSKQMQATNLRPTDFELRFGSGTIDRVDTYMEGDCVYVSVMDYKTGNASFDLVSLYHGLQLQLPIYLSEAIDQERMKHPNKEIIPAGFFYYQMKDPLVPRTEDSVELDITLLKQLKLNGLVRDEERVLNQLEPELMGESYVYQLKRNKDGELSKTSSALNADGFDTVLQYARDKRVQLRQEIESGEVSINPYEYKKHTGCRYCDYKGICGFDLKIPGYQYRALEEVTKDEVVQTMKESLCFGQ